MLIVAILIVVYDWNTTEKKRLQRGLEMRGLGKSAPEEPSSGDESRKNMAAANQRLAMLLMLTVLTMFTLIVATAVFVVLLR